MSNIFNDVKRAFKFDEDLPRFPRFHALIVPIYTLRWWSCTAIPSNLDNNDNSNGNNYNSKLIILLIMINIDVDDDDIDYNDIKFSSTAATITTQ